MKVKSESEVAQLGPTLSDHMDCSLPGSPIMGFSRQEYWSGVPLPSPFLHYSIKITYPECKLEIQHLLRGSELMDVEIVGAGGEGDDRG